MAELCWRELRMSCAAWCRAADEFVLHIGVPDGKTFKRMGIRGSIPGRGRRGEVHRHFLQPGPEGRWGSFRLIWGAFWEQYPRTSSGTCCWAVRLDSRVGIMEPIWEDRSMREIGRGTLVFTKEYVAEDRKARVGGPTLSVSVQRPFNY